MVEVYYGTGMKDGDTLYYITDNSEIKSLEVRKAPKGCLWEFEVRH